VTVVSTLADSYLHVMSHSAGGAAEIASVRKESKYSALPLDYLFQPIAFENLGLLNGSGLNLSKVGRRLSASSQDPRETSFLSQQLSVLIQRYNSVLILESFCLDKIRISSHRGYFFSFLFLALGPYTPEGIKIIIIITAVKK